MSYVALCWIGLVWFRLGHGQVAVMVRLRLGHGHVTVNSGHCQFTVMSRSGHVHVQVKVMTLLGHVHCQVTVTVRLRSGSG